MRLIGFSSRRSCHEVTDEVKACGLILPTSVYRRPCRGAVARATEGFSINLMKQTPPSRLHRATSPKVEAIYAYNRLLLEEKLSPQVTDEVKAHDIMLFSARHRVGRYALMPPIIQNFCLGEI